MRAHFIKARGHNAPHQQAGYKAAILSLSPRKRPCNVGRVHIRARERVKSATTPSPRPLPLTGAREKKAALRFDVLRAK